MIENPIYLKIAKEFIEKMEAGILKPEDKLPSIRTLSKEFHVNKETIVRAYKYLADENYTYIIKGSGSYVLSKMDYVDKVDETIEMQPFNDENTYEGMINFASGSIKSSLFPVTDFKRAINYVLDRDFGDAFSYEDPKGYPPLRKSIEEYLREMNIITDKENIQIVSGAQQGIDIVSKALLSSNDSVIVESPTYKGAVASFHSRGAFIHSVPMEYDGINITKLERVVQKHRPKFMYIMTNFQNPTGFSYSNKKKLRLLELSEKYDFYILEDDYVNELNYKSNAIAPIKTLDKHSKVLYLKSFSKIFMPGLRLGFLIVPEQLNEIILNIKSATDIATSGLIQRTFDIYLSRGNWNTHVYNMKKVYYKRYKIMVEALNKYMPRNIKYYIPKGGIFFWVELGSIDADELYEYLLKKNIAITPGNIFYIDKKNNAIRLSIASVRSEDIEKGIRVLSDGLRYYIDDLKGEK